MIIANRQEGAAIFALIWFVGGQLYAATSDALRLRIPNTLILFLLVGYAANAAQSQPDWTELAASIAVTFAILAGGTILFVRGWMGGGDVKLLAVSGLWLGPNAVAPFLLLTALAGGLLTLALIFGRTLGAHRLAGGRIAALRDPMTRVPYAIAIAAACIAVVVLRPGILLTG